jgi:hypothetical protein
MKVLLLLVKILAALVGGIMLLIVLYVGFVFLRKSDLFVFSSDIEQLAASGPLNNPELASQVCGVPVTRGLGREGGRDGYSSPMTAFPRATLIRATGGSWWWPFYGPEGTASVRIVGVGVNHPGDQAATGLCEATMTFDYHFHWSDNGRAVVLESRMTGPPTIARNR